MKCPVCHNEKVRLAGAKGFVEEKVFWLLFVRPFRCRECRARFYRFSIQNGVQAQRRKRRVECNGASKAEDDREFQQLIAEIAEAERRVFGPEPADGADEEADRR